MAELDELPDAVPSTTETTSTTRSSAKSTSSKQKNATKNQTLSEFSIRKPDWSYIQLQHLSSSNASSTQALDGVTAQLHLDAALSTFLGLHGSAIPIDLLQIEDQDIWIRVPADNRAAVIAAAGGWTSKNGEGWRVKAWSHWNASALGRDAGQDLFDA